MFPNERKVILDAFVEHINDTISYQGSLYW